VWPVRLRLTCGTIGILREFDVTALATTPVFQPLSGQDLYVGREDLERYSLQSTVSDASLWKHLK
jgi:hypothetical protein